MNQKSAGKRLIIIDISNFIFRAFFAIRPLHAPDGTPVNAVQGVLSMLLKLFSAHQPSHIFVARDSKEKSFRADIYPEYKAHRDAPPEELVPQFSLIDRLIDCMGLPELKMPGFEADDIIGSAVVQWKDYFEEVLIATGDKDIMQFVDDKVKVIDTMKDKVFGPKEVYEKMGVHPNQIVDYLSMLGDTSDNIPGMKGIGEKGAAKLLEEFGSLEQCFKNLDKITNKRIKTSFENHFEEGLLSKKLIEIVTNIKLNKTADELHYNFYPSPELLEFLQNLGMKRMVEKLEQMKFDESKAPPSGLVSDKEETLEIDPFQVVQNASLFMDLETKLKAFKGEVYFFPKLNFIPSGGIQLDFLCLGMGEGETFVLPFVDLNQNVALDKNFVQKILLLLWERPEITLIGHDIKHFIQLALDNGVHLKAFYRDLMLESYLIDVDENHSLDFLCSHHLGVSLGSLELSPFEAMSSRVTLLPKLAKHFSMGIDRFNLKRVLEEIEIPLVPVLAEMEREGIRLNKDFLKSLETKFTDELMEIATKIEERSEGMTVNLNSPKQVRELLFDKLQLPIIKTTKTGPSTDSEVLEKLDSMGLSEIPALILKFREVDKLLNTYVVALPKMVNEATGRIHANFNQVGTSTGRLSCDRPNLQNIPIRTEYGRLIRKAFVATPGKLLLSADYSQVELRILAHFSQDARMLKAFERDEDIHVQTAAEIFEIPLAEVSREQRSAAKAINFGLMYGQSSFGLSQTLSIPRAQAKEYITNYFHKFSQVKGYLDGLIQLGSDRGYSETLFGRKRLLKDIRSQNRTIKSMAERLAINSPIQGTAADIIKLAMINLRAEIKKKGFLSRLLLQVHDELIFEVPEEELKEMKALVRFQMENAVQLSVPLKVDMGTGVNWFDLK